MEDDPKVLNEAKGSTAVFKSTQLEDAVWGPRAEFQDIKTVYTLPWEVPMGQVEVSNRLEYRVLESW